MSSPYSMFQTDQKAEKEVGVVLDYGDFRVRVARAGGANKKFGKLFTARLKPYKRMIDSDNLPEEIATKIMVETYADAVILDWESKVKGEGDTEKFVSGIQGKDGGLMPYSREAVIQILTDLPDLFRDIQTQANQLSLFRAAETEDTAKK